MKVLLKSVLKVTVLLILTITPHICKPRAISGEIKTSRDSDHSKISREKRDWTFLVYMAANNNLNKYSIYSIKQMLKIGSTNSIHILVQLDRLGDPTIERFYIEKDKAILLESKPFTLDSISGTPESLYNFIQWSTTNFPANKIAIVLWNHGSGIKDLSFWEKYVISYRDNLFYFNPTKGLYELNYELPRNRNFVNKINSAYQVQENIYKSVIQKELDSKNRDITAKPRENSEGSFSQNIQLDDDRGIAMNDTFHVYLTNQDLSNALGKVCQTLLGGKKIDLICMDACFMAMTEIASQIKNTTKFMVASQEVEPGEGYNYEFILAPFENGSLTPEAFAKHIVVSYEREHSLKFAEYTQSAFNLDSIKKLEQRIAKLSSALLTLIKLKPDEIIPLLKNLRTNKNTITEFYDADYIDFSTLIKGLFKMASDLKRPKKGVTHPPDYTTTLETIKIVTQEILNQIQTIIIKTTKCERLPNACGISIYFPKKNPHESYYRTAFDQATRWTSFLNTYNSLVSTTKTFFIKN